MFPAPVRWFKLVFNSMVKNGDLSLVGDYLIVGLGEDLRDIHKYLESAEDITGSAHVVRTYWSLQRVLTYVGINRPT